MIQPLSEVAVDALRTALRRYARFALSAGDRDPDWKDINGLADSLAAEPAAWSALGVAFEGFLRALEGDIDAARRAYEREVRDVIHQRFAAAIAAGGETGGALKAIAHGERSLRQHLARVTWTRTENDGGAPSPHVHAEEKTS
jgi:AcrR family transcriptional regulator